MKGRIITGRCSYLQIEDPEWRDADFAVEVEDDRMMPFYRKGDYLLAVAQPYINHGELGVFNIRGKLYVKRYYEKGGEVKLLSLNIDGRSVSWGPKVQCLGKVIGHVTKFSAKESIIPDPQTKKAAL